MKTNRFLTLFEFGWICASLDIDSLSSRSGWLAPIGSYDGDVVPWLSNVPRRRRNLRRERVHRKGNGVGGLDLQINGPRVTTVCVCYSEF